MLGDMAKKKKKEVSVFKLTHTNRSVSMTHGFKYSGKGRLFGCIVTRAC